MLQRSGTTYIFFYFLDLDLAICIYQAFLGNN